ncbi:MAG: rRNA maturation RNase YbeY, partial [Chloroflexi bacterium]|nr:rRNA maturation RNase YbeY [Chloroflexota bacterium]
MPRKKSITNYQLPTYKIHIQIAESFAGKVSPAFLRAAARAALKQQKAKSGSLSIVVSGDKTLHDLNKKFLGHDTATDVLSFPSDDPTSSYYGDIAISYPRAIEQARRGGHAVKAELQLLTIHGVLHLLGHDHYTAREKAKMWKAQSEILVILKATSNSKRANSK